MKPSRLETMCMVILEEGFCVIGEDDGVMLNL
jgi:hypothetical protein